MTKPLSKVSQQVQENERRRAISIIKEIYGGAPKGTIAEHCCTEAIHRILEEDKKNE
jgi:hypothetical protein